MMGGRVEIGRFEMSDASHLVGGISTAQRQRSRTRLRHRLGVVLAPADLAEPLARAREACALRRSAAVEGERGGCARLLVSATLCVLYVGLHTVQCHGASGVSM